MKMRIRESARRIVYFKSLTVFADQLSSHAKLGLRIIYARANREKSRTNEVAFRNFIDSRRQLTIETISSSFIFELRALRIV